MILHLAEDSIFLDYVIEHFETAAPGNNKYLIHIPNKNYKLKHINNKEKVITSKWPSRHYMECLGDIDNYDFVVLHCLLNYKVDIVNRAPSNAKFLWMFWGHEIYNRIIEENDKCFLPRTRLISKQLVMRISLKDRVKRVIAPMWHIINGTPNPYEEHKKALKRVDYCGTFIKEDYELASPYLSQKASWQWYCYYSIETVLGQLFEETCNGNNILVGNSSSLTNNHIDAFELLSNFNLEGKKVITPISYGNKSYRDFVITYGDKCFGESFEPLLKFLPREEYNKIVQSCGIVIMNHNRQQAVGNILTALWLGAKVYLNECNTVYQYMKRIGIKVFSIQNDLTPDNVEALELLSDQTVESNRKLLLNEFSHKNILRKTKELTENIMMDKC